MGTPPMGCEEGFPGRAPGSLTSDPRWVPKAILLLGQTCRANLQGAQVWVLERAQLVHRDHLPMGEPAERARMWPPGVREPWRRKATCLGVALQGGREEGTHARRHTHTHVCTPAQALELRKHLATPRTRCLVVAPQLCGLENHVAGKQPRV